MTGVGSDELLSNRLGSYELLRPLAQGGMADIYLARRVGPGQFEHHVALKVLSKSRAADPDACAMFLDEARLVAMLNHHNIASVLDVDVVDGNHYLAMEYVDGADLRAVVVAAQRARQKVPFDAALSIVCAAAAGLDHAHRRCGPDGAPLELVHRDVSLSNIMVGHDGAVKVVDFGIASTTIASVRTLPGMVRGKASYMSPEQCLGDEVDHRSDVFGLGVVLFELTTGTRCFHGKTDFDRMLAVVRNDYTPPSELVADFPADLEQVIRRALANNPERRYESAAAMIDALEQVAGAHGWAAGPRSIQRLMRILFGDASTLLPSPFDDAPVTELCPALAPAAVPDPTRPARRLARGTECGADDDLDERTRGRGPVRRIGKSWLAA
jgi:serine/threonine-protein kinase